METIESTQTRTVRVKLMKLLQKNAITLLRFAGLDNLLLSGKTHSKPFKEYSNNDITVCPNCHKEYANGTPKYCYECKKRLRDWKD